MTDDTPETSEFELIFEGREADDHRVAASAVAQAIQGLQRTVFLVAMEHEHVDVRRRERTSRKLEEKYAVLVGPPREGSLVFSASIGPTTGDVAAPPDLFAVTSDVKDVFAAIEHGDEAGVARIVSDRSRRVRLIETVRTMMPKTGSGLRMRIVDRSGESVFNSVLAHKSLSKLVSRSLQEPLKRAVIGRLVTIKFDERKLTILYQPNNRELECIYEEAVEPLLLEHPRDLIQVTGEVILDEQDQPKRIIDVDEILEVDMSAFHMTQFEYPDRVLSFKAEMAIEPELDESQQLMILREESLGIDVVAATREELFQGLVDEIEILWRNYAQAPDTQLSPAASQLKQRLLDAIEERPLATR